jgi:regulator of Ty1 transposition protein 103
MISMPNSDTHVYMPAQQLTAAPNHSYPSVLVTQPTMHNAAPALQGQYNLYCNPPSQQYVQSTGGVISPYGYGNIPPLQSVPPQPPFMNQTLQITQQQPVPTFTNQTMQITQQQPVPVTQYAPAPPSFRPIQPSGMMYYANH